MKKVLFISSLYYPHVGGIETMIVELSQFYQKQGIESVVLTKKWPETLSNKEEYRDTKIYRVKSARTEDEFNNIIEWIKNNEDKIKADIIHAIGIRRPLPLIGLLLSHHWNVPMISTIAGSEIPSTDEPQSDIVWSEGRDIMRPVIELSDVVTCVSKSLAADLLKVIPNTKLLETIYAGVDTQFINSIACTETEKDYIISLRRLVPSKGIDVLIRAFKEIADEYPRIKLIIAGEGPEEINLKSLSAELSLENRIEFIGTIPLLRAVSLLKGAICTVVPSLSEGGGLVNVEAQAASCPVIASRVGGIPEYVEDGVSGLLFESKNSKDLANKMKMIISNKALRNKLILGGIKHAEKFSWEILGPKYLSLYRKMIDQNKEKSFQPWSALTNQLWLKLRK